MLLKFSDAEFGEVAEFSDVDADDRDGAITEGFSGSDDGAIAAEDGCITAIFWQSYKAAGTFIAFDVVQGNGLDDVFGECRNCSTASLTFSFCRSARITSFIFFLVIF